MLGKAINCNTIIVRNEIEALEIAQNRCPDLIIIGGNISFQSTKDLVKAVKNNPDTINLPILKISASLNKQALVEYVALGIDDILLINNFKFNSFVSRVNSLLKKRFSQDSLKLIDSNEVSKAQQYQAQTGGLQEKAEDLLENAKPLISLSVLEKRLSKVASIKTLPFIVSELLSLTSSMDTDIKDMVKLIESDYALTSRILRLANSAFYSRSKIKVYNLRDAIKSIGFNGIKEIVIGLNTINFLNENTVCPELSRVKLWYYAFSVGVIAKEIAFLTRQPLPESAFVIGLLTDIGIAILDDQFNDEFKTIMEVCFKTKFPLARVEDKLLGLKHNEISAKLLKNWNFPDEIVIPISMAHLSFAEIISLDEKYNKYKTEILINKLAQSLTKLFCGCLLNTEVLEEIPDEIFTYSYLSLQPKDLFESTYKIKRTVKDVMQIMLLHLNPNVITQCDVFNYFGSFKANTVLILQSVPKALSTIDVILNELDFQVTVSDNFSVDLVKAKKPQAIIFDITEDYSSILDFIGTLSTRRIIDNTLIVIVSEKANIEKIKTDIEPSREFIFLAKPIILDKMVSFLQDFTEKIKLKTYK